MTRFEQQVEFKKGDRIILVENAVYLQINIVNNRYCGYTSTQELVHSMPKDSKGTVISKEDFLIDEKFVAYRVYLDSGLQGTMAMNRLRRI